MPNLVLDKSYAFALKIISLCKNLQKQKEFVISGQLFRSGTSIGANAEEAGAGQTKKDFIAKMAIASKEARETNYWLRLLRDSKICSSSDIASLIRDSEELVNILTSIVKTSQKTNEKPNVEPERQC
jgi:four helix bundle protein